MDEKNNKNAKRNREEAIGVIKAFDMLHPEKKTLIEAHAQAIAALYEQAGTLIRCSDCEYWDKSMTLFTNVHACTYWSPSRKEPRYTEGFEFCSFASEKQKEEPCLK